MGATINDRIMALSGVAGTIGEDAAVFWSVGLRSSRSGTAQSRPTKRGRLATKPVVCQRAIPYSTFIDRQVSL